MKFDIYKAGGIIIRDRKLLVAKAKNKEFYVSPGGKLENHENAKQALKRELLEEFNIQTNESDFEEFGTFYAEAAGQDSKILRMDVFIVKKWLGDITASSEIEKILWIDSNNIDNIKIGSIFEHNIIPELKSRRLID